MKIFAALAALWITAALMLVVFLLDDDSTCGTAVPAPASPGAPLPAGSKVYPVAQGVFTITDGFGARGGAHKGTDYAAPEGTPIYAAMDGVVHDSGPASGFGDWIVLDHNINGEIWSTVYGHMYEKDLLVHVGDQIAAGQQISRVGTNGESTGPHLHFEVWTAGGRNGGGTPIDSVPWLEGAAQPGAGPAPTPGATPAPGVTVDPAAAAGTGTGISPTTPAPAPAPTTTGNSAGCAPADSGGGVDNLQPGLVPPEFEPWYRRAGALCPQISSSLLAAQGRQEGGFSPEGGANTSALSQTGAQGPSQFEPYTWTSWGAPVDDQGTPIGPVGTGDIHKPSDAIMAQGRFMCHIAEAVDGWISSGQVHWSGDRRELYVAGYNAGEGAVLSSGGFPTGSSDYVTQTRPYVDNILAMEPQYRRALS
ncbi:M23 family metallopeptidase [Nocardia sp. NBC_01327]|uniref:M23 family metallopeptidase n=1 Tax=Nocardia sp. NBC_01327 TaxID=2903593 RepID=UPI002E111593|nr:M23 family metallopeptidase [Nocardia sp. NBC_01327]